MAKPGTEEVRDQLARWLFERNYSDRSLATPDVATFDEYVEKNQEEWREEADVVLSVIDDLRAGQTPMDPRDDW